MKNKQQKIFISINENLLEVFLNPRFAKIYFNCFSLFIMQLNTMWTGNTKYYKLCPWKILPLPV